jgi:integrase
MDGFLRRIAMAWQGCWQVSSHWPSLRHHILSHAARQTSNTLLLALNTVQFMAPSDDFTAMDRRSGHWALIIVQLHRDPQGNVTKCSVGLADSLKGTVRSDQLTIIGKLFGNLFPSAITEYKNIPCVQQTNVHDCGVFVLVAALRHMIGLPLTDKFNVELVRKEIWTALVNDNANLPSICTQAGKSRPIQGTQSPQRKQHSPAVILVDNRTSTEPEDFRPGEVGPRFAPMIKGAMLLTLTPHPVRNQALIGGLSPTTRMGHLRAFEVLKDRILAQPRLAALPLPMLILEVTLELAKTGLGRTSKPWAPSTALKFLLQAVNFLLRLDQYADMTPIDLRTSKLLSDALRYFRKEVNKLLSRPKPYLTILQIHAILTLPMDPDTRAALILCWSTAARPSNTALLLRSNIKLTRSGEGSTIYWTAAKTSLARGPYSTPLQLGPHHDFILNWLANKPEGPLFEVQNTSHLLNFLRKLRLLLPPGCDLRSLRRGALISLAEAGMEDRELMTLSGHTQLSSLRRYLQWRIPATQARLVREGALHLWA